MSDTDIMFFGNGEVIILMPINFFLNLSYVTLIFRKENEICYIY